MRTFSTNVLKLISKLINKTKEENSFFIAYNKIIGALFHADYP